MKKIKYIITAALITAVLTACGKASSVSLDDYQANMAKYYESINEASHNIDSLDINDENACQLLLGYIDSIQSDIIAISSLETPKSYTSVKEMATSAASSIDSAASIYHEIYANNSFENFDEAKNTEASQNYIDAMNKLNEIGNIIKTKTLELDGN